MFKKIAISLVAILSILVLATGIFVYKFDINQYKPELIDWVQKHTQRTLTIEGDIGLSVLPQLAITLPSLTLSEQGRPDTFARVRSARLQLALLPLLTRRIQIGHIQAQGVQFNYWRNAQGLSNIDDLLSSTHSDASADAKPAEPAASPKSTHLDISGITLSDVSVQIHDEKTQVQGSVKLATLEMGRLADNTQTPIELDVSFNLSQPAIQGRLVGSTQFQLLAQGISLSKAKLGFNGQAMGFKEAQVTLAGSLALNTQDASISARQLQVQVSGRIADLALANSQLSLTELNYQPAAQQLRLQDLVLKIKGQRASSALLVNLKWPQLQVQAQSLRGSALSGEFEWGTLRAKFSSLAPSGSFSAIHLPGFSLSTNDNTLSADLTVQPESYAVTLTQLRGSMALPLAGKTQHLQAAGAASYNGKTQSASWDLRGQFNDAPYSTRGNARLGMPVPNINAQLALARLNTDQLGWTTPAKSGSGSNATQTASNKPSTPAAATAPIDLKFITAFSGSVNASINQLITRGIELKEVQLNLHGDGQRLDIPSFSAQAWQGSVRGSAAVVAQGNNIAFKALAEDMRIEQVLQDLSGSGNSPSKLTGTARLALDVRSSGANIAQMRSRLEGRMQAQLRNGAVKGIDLAKILRQAKTALRVRQDEVQKTSATEQTAFSNISATLNIAQGIARNTDLSASSPLLKLSGQGQVDLGRSTIDYLLQASMTDAAIGQDSGALSVLRGIQIPVKLSGPFDGPQYQVQWSAIVGAALKEKLKSQLSEKLGITESTPNSTDPTAREQLKDKLKDKLKGLLRR